MYCWNCGEHLNDNAVICTKCGCRLNDGDANGKEAGPYGSAMPPNYQNGSNPNNVPMPPNYQNGSNPNNVPMPSNYQSGPNPNYSSAPPNYQRELNLNFSSLSPYYQREFQMIYESNEKYKGTFNVWAFFGVFVWALTKGCWLSAIAYIGIWLVTIPILGLGAVAGWFIYGFRGTYMYYCAYVKHEQRII